MTKKKEFRTIEQVEREMIFDALERHNFNKQAVARELGVTPATIRNKLAKYGFKVIREVVVPIEDASNAEREFEPFKGRAKLRG